MPWLPWSPLGCVAAFLAVLDVCQAHNPKDNPEYYVFRGDSRDPEEIRAAGGFLPDPDAASYTSPTTFGLDNHVNGRTGSSAYVSTSAQFGQAARNFAGPGNYVYRIHVTPNMINVNEALSSSNPYPRQEEASALGGIPWSAVEGWLQLEEDREFETSSEYLDDASADRFTDRYVVEFADQFEPNRAYDDRGLGGPARQTRADPQVALLAAQPPDEARLINAATTFMNNHALAIGWTENQAFPLQFGTYSLDGLPGLSANDGTQVERPPPAGAQVPALNEDDIIVAAEFLRDHNAPCDVSGVDPQSQWLTLEADSTIAQALARLHRERPNDTLPTPIEEADEQIQAIIERLRRGQEPNTCQLVGECSRLRLSQKKRARTPAGVSKLCKKIQKPKKSTNGLDEATQNSEKCVLRSPLKIKVQLSDDTSAGSWDRLFLEIGKNARYEGGQPHYLLKESPSAGDLMSLDVDLADAYPNKAVTIENIKEVRLVSRLDNGGVGSNQLELQDITLTGKCAASPKVAEARIKAKEWFTNWGTDLKPKDWAWKKDCDKFTSLKFEWSLGNKVRAGTWDDLKLGSHRDRKVLAHDIQFATNPSAGNHGAVAIKLKETYGSASVPIDRIDFFHVYSTTRWPDSSEDQWEFGGIKFKAQCEGFDKAIILDKFGSDYNWHSRSNGIDLPIAATDWRWEDENFQKQHPFPREEL
ncbi:heat-labile enterotoxin IIB, A chain [Metarhizium guizhouense ARSEF 977]|uniref:Heat-labile enterotoxin IIB, A chain n=1 Tax=Metarhizium guizhouense (strain ARSEF 977) TaxID=1276136 RepID=A0A0B4G3T3_METGA|nr:heat-labile enterotoxin IIB, A chain [Metarhizium guizhouense ARSEF 977]